MHSCFGFDTSNYTTSFAICFSDGTIKHAKKLLPVKSGQCGLRQSDMVFHHVNTMPEVFYDVVSNIHDIPSAIGVSAKPRYEYGSYMPCFNVGMSFAKVLSGFLHIPYYEFSHQSGHIAAALYSAEKLGLLKDKFLAFHVSGGTTEAVLVSPDEINVIRTKVIAKTLDLNAGQLIDRIGVMLGLNFPCGAELELLAQNCNDSFKINPTLKGADCCLSGVENICMKMKSDGQYDEKIARFCIEYIAATIDKMCECLLKQYGDIPILFAGGVMSNSIIKQGLSCKYNAVFGEPLFSSDNAAGIAVLTAIKAGLLP